MHGLFSQSGIVLETSHNTFTDAGSPAADKNTDSENTDTHTHPRFQIPTVVLSTSAGCLSLPDTQINHPKHNPQQISPQRHSQMSWTLRNKGQELVKPTLRGGVQRSAKIKVGRVIMFLTWHLTCYLYLCTKHLHYTAPFCCSHTIRSRWNVGTHEKFSSKPAQWQFEQSSLARFQSVFQMLVKITIHPAFPRMEMPGCLLCTVAQENAAIVWPVCMCLHVIRHRYVMPYMGDLCIRGTRSWGC